MHSVDGTLIPEAQCSGGDTLTGGQLRRWRRRQGWTLAQAGEVLGLDASTLSRYEREVIPIPKPIELLVAFLPLGATTPPTARKNA